MMKETYKSPSLIGENSFTGLIPLAASLATGAAALAAEGYALSAAALVGASVGAAVGRLMKGGSDARLRCKLDNFITE